MPRTRRRKGNRRVTRKMRGGSGRGSISKKKPANPPISNVKRVFSIRNPITGNTEVVDLTNVLEAQITNKFKMFRDYKNIDTLQISEDGKRLVMKDADGVLRYVSIIYARGHGQIVKASARVNITCPNNIAIIQTGKGDYLDHSIFSALAPTIFKLLFESNP